MPYLSSLARRAYNESYREGFAEGFVEGFMEWYAQSHMAEQQVSWQGKLQESVAESLSIKFGASSKRLLPRVRAIRDLKKIAELVYVITTAESLAEVERQLNSATPREPECQD